MSMQQCPVCGGPTQWSSANCNQCDFRKTILKNTTGHNGGNTSTEPLAAMLALVIGGMLLWTLLEWIWVKMINFLYLLL